KPGRDCRACLEPPRLPPDVEEYLAGDILGEGLAAEQPQYEAVDTRMVPCEQDLHREPIAGCDLCDERLVRIVLGRGRSLRGGYSRTSPAKSLRIGSSPVGLPTCLDRPAETFC